MAAFTPFSADELDYIQSPQNNITVRPQAIIASIVRSTYVPSLNALTSFRMMEAHIKNTHPNTHAAYIEGRSTSGMGVFWMPITLAMKNGDIFESDVCLVQDNGSANQFYKIQPIEYTPPRFVQPGNPAPNHVVVILSATKALGAYDNPGKSNNRQAAPQVAIATAQIHGRVANALAFTTVNLGLPSTQYGPGNSSSEVILVRPSVITQDLETIADVVKHSTRKSTFPTAKNTDALLKTYKAADRLSEILRKGLAAFPPGKTPAFVMGTASGMAIQMYELGSFLKKSRLPDWVAFGWIKRCFLADNGLRPSAMTAAFDEMDIFTVGQLKLFSSNMDRKPLIKKFKKAGLNRADANRLFALHCETPVSEAGLTASFLAEKAFSGSLYANHDPLPSFLPESEVITISDDDDVM